MKRVYLFANIYPLYRKSIWDRLLRDKTLDFNFFFSLKTIDNIATVELKKEYNLNDRKVFKPLKNIYLSKWLVWQLGVIPRAFDNIHSVIFLGEMTVLSTWIAGLIYRLRGVKVIFWGHGLYGSENFLKSKIRVLFLKLANHNLVYEKRAKQLMIKNGFKVDNISVIYNSINFDEQKELFKKHLNNPPNGLFDNNNPTLLFIGRLTSQKKVEQLIQAVTILNRDGFNCNLIIVGDGPQKKKLEILAGPLIKKDKCLFYGATYNETEISRLIFSSQLVVSPGNIGLTAIHSLSYGTPVFSHSNFKNQMPEVEAIIDGENGFLFIENDIESLKNGIQKWFIKNPSPDRLSIREVIDKYYNPDYQIKVIKKICC